MIIYMIIVKVIKTLSSKQNGNIIYPLSDTFWNSKVKLFLNEQKHVGQFSVSTFSQQAEQNLNEK